MTSLEKEIEDLKKKHAQLELDQYNEKLQKKYEKLKQLEGTVEVRIFKANKTSRHASLVYHISYEMLVDNCRHENENQRHYIGQTVRTIDIFEMPRRPDKRFRIETNEITPKSYNGKINAEEESNSYDFSTYKTVSIDVFNAIYSLAKTSVANILDGILDVKEVKWLLNGTDEDFEYNESDLVKDKKYILDVSHILVTTEESWILNNKFTRLFLNHNLFLITPNSLKALDDWLSYEITQNDWSYTACASIGERWRGSRIDEYKRLIKKIKQH